MPQTNWDRRLSSFDTSFFRIYKVSEKDLTKSFRHEKIDKMFWKLLDCRKQLYTSKRFFGVSMKDYTLHKKAQGNLFEIVRLLSLSPHQNANASHGTINQSPSHKRNKTTVTRMWKVHLLWALFQDQFEASKAMVGWVIPKKLKERQQRLDRSKEAPTILSDTRAVLQGLYAGHRNI